MKLISLAPLCAAAALCSAILPSVPSSAQSPSNATVYASGLQGPRGLKFGSDGYLYVAEAGLGGSQTTVGQCQQVPPPGGPYHGGKTGRISRIDRSGKRTTFAYGFPSGKSGFPTGDTAGVADIAFLSGEMYTVTAGGGCSHGNPSLPNAIFRVDKNGAWSLVSNLSRFLQTHPAKYPNLADFEPDGTFYSLIAADGLLYTVEPNHGQVFSISPSGATREVIDVSEAEGHIVPTAIVARDGEFYLGNLNTFPIVPNSAKILTLTHCVPTVHAPGLDLCTDWNNLKVSGSRAGFATVVAADFGPDGLLYVLELSAAAGFPAPGQGRVVRLNRDGSIQTVVSGLTVPTGMTFGPDGHLYVSNLGAAPGAVGQILRIAIP